MNWLAIVQVACIIALFAMAMLRERYWKNRLAQQARTANDTLEQISRSILARDAAQERDHKAERTRWNLHLIEVRKQRDEWRDKSIRYKDALDGKTVLSDNHVVDNRYMINDDIGQAVVQDAVRRSTHRIADSITRKATVSLEPQPHMEQTIVHVKVYLKDLLP